MSLFKVFYRTISGHYSVFETFADHAGEAESECRSLRSVRKIILVERF